MVDAVVEELNAIDILFAALGVGTAWGVVARRSRESSAAARRAQRESRRRTRPR